MKSSTTSTRAPRSEIAIVSVLSLGGFMSRLDVFIYQIVGILAGSVVSWIWSAADPAGSIFHWSTPVLGYIAWWGQSFDTRAFLLISLAIARPSSFSSYSHGTPGGNRIRKRWH